MLAVVVSFFSSLLFFAMPAIWWLRKMIEYSDDTITTTNDDMNGEGLLHEYDDVVVSGEAKSIEYNPSQVHMGAFFDTNIAIIKLETNKYTPNHFPIARSSKASSTNRLSHLYFIQLANHNLCVLLLLLFICLLFIQLRLCFFFCT